MSLLSYVLREFGDKSCLLCKLSRSASWQDSDSFFT